MKKTNYWMVRIYITYINKIKLKTGLKISGILENVRLTNYIKSIIFVLVNPEFVHSKINFMPENNSKAKAKILSIYKNSTFFFIYNMRTTDLAKFFNPSLCDINKFWPKTKVTVKLQIYSYNFKIKRQERNLGYYFKLIGFYKL